MPHISSLNFIYFNSTSTFITRFSLLYCLMRQFSLVLRNNKNYITWLHILLVFTKLHIISYMYFYCTAAVQMWVNTGFYSCFLLLDRMQPKPNVADNLQCFERQSLSTTHHIRIHLMKCQALCIRDILTSMRPLSIGRRHTNTLRRWHYHTECIRATRNSGPRYIGGGMKVEVKFMRRIVRENKKRQSTKWKNQKWDWTEQILHWLV